MTTITESFNKADGAGWGPDQTWTGISGSPTTTSNQATGLAAAYVGTSLDDDQYCQAVMQASRRTWVMCRWGNNDNDWYMARVAAVNGPLQLWKRVGGTYTQLGTGTNNGGSGSTVRVEADGTSIKGILDGSTEVSVSDSAVSSGYGALRHESGAITDDWEAGDLSTPVAASTRRARLRRTHMSGNVHR